MKVAVFGAGTMGLGIIQVFAEKGNTVLVYDISMDFVRNQVQKLEASLAKRVARGKMTQEKKKWYQTESEPGKYEVVLHQNYKILLWYYMRA